MIRFVRSIAFVAAFASVNLHAAGDVNGTWSGTANVVDSCDEKLVSWSSPITMHLTHSGSTVTGTLLLAESDIGCSGKAPRAFLVAGSISGTTASLSAANLGTGTGSAVVSGSSMTVTFPGQEDPRTGLTASLTRTSSIPPGGNLSGPFSGRLTVTDRCPNGTFTTTSPLYGTLVQTGDLLAGVVRVTEPQHVDREDDGACRLHVCTSYLETLLTAQISGGSVVGTIAVVHVQNCNEEGDGGGEVIPFTGSIHEGTMTGTTSDGALEFSMTRGIPRRRPVRR